MSTVKKSDLDIDWSGLDAFRATLPVDGELDFRQEYFRFLTSKWDIVKAQYILEKIPHELGKVNVEKFARVLGLTKTPAMLDNLGGLYHVDEERVMGPKIDLRKPIILAHVIEGSVDGITVLDGVTRLTKAYRYGFDYLSAYLLTHEEELACRM